jgi:hydrogenase maturation protein HypF
VVSACVAVGPADPTGVRVRAGGAAADLTPEHDEDQAAIELEAACDLGEQRADELPLLDDEGPLEIDARPMIRAVVADVEARGEVGTIAGRFHNGLAEATARGCALAAERRMTELGVLSGGVFQNRRLLWQASSLLADAGLQEEGGADVRA